MIRPPKHTTRLAVGALSLGIVVSAPGCGSASPPSTSESVGSASQAASAFPQYDHVFLIINENHNFPQIMGNSAAPIINALAEDYGLATQYTGVSDPSEPNYVAMLGGSDFGIASDDPYFFPGQTVNADNLLSQLEAAGKTWRGYFQDMPYPGYRGYCFPGKCNGIPDSDTEYVAKHNGIVNFANMQTPAEWAKQMPYTQLADDLSEGNVPNFGYIVADECHDMHGAPPWCVDSGNPGDVDDVWLVSQGDKFVGETVHAITSATFWKNGNNAILVTFDEGNTATDRVPMIVVTSHGPRDVKDKTPYSHYSLLASVEQTFGLGCLLNSCTATPMAPLFAITGAKDVPALPAPFVPAANGNDQVTATGSPKKGPAVTLGAPGWNVVPSPSFGMLDNNLAAVSAGCSSDAWAVGSFYPPGQGGNVLRALGLHFDGTRWTGYPLPNVGLNENSLLGVSELPSGEAWAVGYYQSADYKQRTLIEHYDGTDWKVVASPNPGSRQNIVYGVAAISNKDVWAVGGTQNDDYLWRTLALHWDGDEWSVVPTVDPGATGNVFYAVSASSTGVYATGQIAGTGFPGVALVERWDGTKWNVVSTPADPGGTDMSLAVTASGASVTIVGDRESSLAPYTTFVASGTASGLGLLSSPNEGTTENDLFGAATAADGSTWAVGWTIDATTGNHDTLLEQGAAGTWSLVTGPNPNPSNGDNGLSSVAAIPGGGLWAVGITPNTAGNPSTLILYHP
jgi:hypothetical protein